MSKIAPSSHQRPSPASWACPRSSTHRTEPSGRTSRYSRAKGCPVPTDFMTDCATYSWSSGCSMLANVRTALPMKSLAGYPVITSISSLSHSMVQSPSQAQR
jgi:hypothetical protein